MMSVGRATRVTASLMTVALVAQLLGGVDNTPATAASTARPTADQDAALRAESRATAEPADLTPVRILPFGDSITYGVGSSTVSGYRGALQANLDRWGRRYRFVGSRASGSMAQPANEGHPGWRIDRLADIERRTILDYAPNVVLLHIGTNDIKANLDLDTAPEKLRRLIDAIDRDAPGVTVLVGSLMGTTWSDAIDANMMTFNRRASALVETMRAAGRKVAWVDMGQVTTADLRDGLHPNDTGYAKMADAWTVALGRASAAGWLTVGGVLP